MELRPCEECGRVISSEAVECPYCGCRIRQPLTQAPPPEPKEQLGRSLPPFVLIGIIAAVVVVIVIAYFIETAPQRQIAANEKAVISALRTLSSAQELYKTVIAKYADYYQLYDGMHQKYIDASLAAADPDHPDHQPLNGYIIDISLHPDGWDWCAFATPVRWGIDGTRNFRITSDGVIRYNETENSSEFTEVLGSA
jgi:hypothetical protein